MSFKSYFYESLKQRAPRKPKLEGYTTPPTSKTKFKEGDIVLVNVPMNNSFEDAEEEIVKYFRTHHPALAVPYIAKAGIVKLYKRGSIGFGAKYGVLFEDGNIIPIHSLFLIGPFTSIESAKKHKGIHSYKVNIKAKDLAGFEPDREVEVDQKVEEAFKNHFVGGEVNFEWLETPIVIKYRTFDCYVLAIKRNIYSNEQMDSSTKLQFLSNNIAMDRLDNPTHPQYDNCFIFCKVINKQTKKLQKTQVLTSIGSRGPGFYFMQNPELSRYVSKDAFEGPFVKNHLRLYSINVNPFKASTKQCEQIKANFKMFEDEESIKTGYDYFKAFYKIKEGQTIINSDDVIIDEERFGLDFKEISKYSIEGDCTIRLEDSTKSITYLPLRANSLTIAAYRLNSLEGISKCEIQKELIIASNLKNLKGFPSSINEKRKMFEIHNELDCLEGIPNLVLCHISIRELKSFVGAEDCVCKGIVQVQKFTGKELNGFFKEAENFSSWTISQADIEQHKKFRDLRKKLPELEGIFE